MAVSTKMVGIGCVAFSAVLFGFMPLMAKISYDAGVNTCMIALGRYFFGALLAALLLQGKHLFTGLGWLQMRKLFSLSLLYAAMPILLYASYCYIDSGLATTLHFTYPTVVMVIMAVFFGSRFTPRELGSLFLCTGGLFLLLNTDGDISLLGMGIALLSGVLYALYIVFLGKSGLRHISVLTLTFWLSLFATLELALVAALSGNLCFTLTPQAWMAELGLGFFTTTLALGLFQKGVFLCGAVKASLFSTLEPVTGIVVGMAAFQERLSTQMVVGIALILLSVVVVCTDSSTGGKRSVEQASPAQKTSETFPKRPKRSLS